ncbi:hypothetical protein E2562_019756 [Oryza meyeriana var. granulata]|uniref:Uncharacterized protein n=1 Tax=Oryza meyeriana var. granulata TaxID=110450 RepID=A0A6G1DLG2_9ORYZ|nr:hypothetical protein E2562_019756 [Oryza meyeriana var. granulata]
MGRLGHRLGGTGLMARLDGGLQRGAAVEEGGGGAEKKMGQPWCSPAVGGAAVDGATAAQARDDGDGSIFRRSSSCSPGDGERWQQHSSACAVQRRVAATALICSLLGLVGVKGVAGERSRRATACRLHGKKRGSSALPADPVLDGPD